MERTIGALTIKGTWGPGYDTILTSDALALTELLVRRFGQRREALLARRSDRQAFFDRGGLPDFLPETASIRQEDWRIDPIPDDLKDRRVEITGPADRKMIINALNSPVRCFMADFEDSLSPTWENLVEGQGHLRDAAAGTISHTSPDGKEYRLKDHPAVLLCRPRGLHLDERHVCFEDKPIPGAFFDFSLYVYHNARQLLARGSGPYFYLPKTESHLEAALWSDMMDEAERHLGIPAGSIKATVLIETLPAVFEMDEILHALRHHIVALNCGRWDYIFSYIKTLRQHKDRILPDRNQVTMDKPFLDAYSRLLIRTCHRRGALAMGGMAAFIPVKGDEEKNAAAMAKVRADKEREARNGHDGTWIAHPGLAQIATETFDRFIGPGKQNQLHVLRAEDPPCTAADLLAVPEGTITEAGMRANIRVGLQYIAAWLSGNGCVPIYNLMEDAATAEICRTQLWQWLHHGVHLDGKRPFTRDLLRSALQEELQVVADELGAQRFEALPFDRAAGLLQELCLAETCPAFLTIPAYQLLS
jgi:malate synthase